MKTLIILSGIPGAGKTYYANQLVHDFTAVHEKAIIVSSDIVRAQVSGTAQNHDNEPEVWARYEQYIKDFSFDYDVVIADSTAVSNNLRMKWFNRFHGHFDRLELHWFDMPFSICWESNLTREKPVPLDAVANLYRMYQEPNFEVIEHFDYIRKVDR